MILPLFIKILVVPVSVNLPPPYNVPTSPLSMVILVLAVLPPSLLPPYISLKWKPNSSKESFKSSIINSISLLYSLFSKLKSLILFKNC